MGDDIRNRSDLVSDVEADVTNLPDGWDRRAFMMRSAMIGAVSVLTGCAPSTPEQTAKQRDVGATGSRSETFRRSQCGRRPRAR